jgi:signal transduction histidine kinase/CheY-like chemotaxis protein
VKRWFSALPVHRKLVASALAITMIATLAATMALIGLDVWRYRLAADDDIASFARIIAENSAAALAFKDPDAAAETLATTRVRRRVTRACMYLPDGTLFAQYARDAALPCADRPTEGETWLLVNAQVPVTRGGRVLGTVFAERDSADLGQRVMATAITGLLTLMLAGFLAYAIAQPLHRTVSRPIAQLAAAARHVGTPAYTIPRIQTNPDEIGELVGALTGMMERVQDANAGLLKEIEERRRIEAERESLLVREREASRLKDEFLAAVSHELRTPLNAIVGWVQILKMGNTDPETLSKAVATIGRNAHAQARVIEDLVDVSRIVTGKLHLKFQAVDLRPLAEAAAEIARPSASAKSLVMELTLPAGASLVNGDPDRIQQVVSNLLSNAVKFSPAGGRITLTLLEAGGAYEIRVADTGIGISPDFLPHVFERFRQSDGSMTREHGGLGLGLAIVKEITELHGGSVRAESAGRGRGAELTVRLPKLLLLEPASARTARPEPAAQQSLAGISVLAVDDNADALDVVAATLVRAGAVVRVARSGAEAIGLWQQEPADVLLCDLAMPVMDGFEVLRRIRLEHRGASVRALALSAHASRDYVERTARAGFVGHVAKPYATAELINAVATAAAKMSHHD